MNSAKTRPNRLRKITGTESKSRGDLLSASCFITCYAATVMLLIGTGVLPHDLIPYFFMDLANNSVFLSLFAFAFIYGAAYFASWLLSELNRRGSWLWFRDLTKPRKSLR